MPFYAIDGIRPVVHPSAYIHPTAILIGDVIVGSGCYIGPAASLRGDFGRIVLEENCNVQDTCVMHGFPDTDTIIEAEGHIGHGAVLHGCIVKANALVGMNAVVMDGAVIGESAFVAAMAFVKAGFDVPARHLVGGIPAKVMRELSDDEIKWKEAGTEDYKSLTSRSIESMIETSPLSEVEKDRKRIPVTAAAVPLYKLK